MTQPKRKKDERAELVKLFRTVLPGDFVKVLENGIQSIIEAELSSILGAEPYQRVEGRTNYRNGYRERKEYRIQHNNRACHSDMLLVSCQPRSAEGQ